MDFQGRRRAEFARQLFCFQGERFFGSITETHSQPGNIERVVMGERVGTLISTPISTPSEGASR